MRWIWCGGECFDLSRVERVRRASSPRGLFVTVVFLSGQPFNLSGQDAEAFLAEWQAYTSARVVGGELQPVIEPITFDLSARLAGQTDR
jgi:hypothetical protein